MLDAESLGAHDCNIGKDDRGLCAGPVSHHHAGPWHCTALGRCEIRTHGFCCDRKVSSQHGDIRPTPGMRGAHDLPVAFQCVNPGLTQTPLWITLSKYADQPHVALR
ncbi:hypothetical protein GCM10007382_01220 [Salinibacterium xinjiangense]|nr:hypothetical protein GCM10007382_01220 [Salinibacterium xinjiangense]